MDEDTLNLLANTMYQAEMIKELQLRDPTITAEKARELVSNNMQYAVKEGNEARKTLESIVPVILGGYVRKG